MAKLPKPDQRRVDAALREAFRQVEAQPLPEALSKQIDSLTAGQGRRRTQ